MIRDPSDGTVREKMVQSATDVAGASRDHPTSEIVEAIKAGKVKSERLSEEWVYQRAWNDGLDFSITQVRRIEKSRSTQSGEG